MAKEKKEKKTGPKRPLSAYMYYVQDARAELVKENPGMKFEDVGKELGKRWKELSEAEKKPYQKKAEADKARYEAAKNSAE